jgi:hypothetical protein
LGRSPVPVLFWITRQNILAEAELGTAFESNETSIELGCTGVSFFLTNTSPFTRRTGKFISRFGIFLDGLSPSWIN